MNKNNAYAAGVGAGLGLLLAYLIWRYGGRAYKDELVTRGNAAADQAASDPAMSKALSDATLDYAEITTAEWALAGSGALVVGLLAAYYTKSVPTSVVAAAIVGLLIIHLAQRMDENKLRALIGQVGAIGPTSATTSESVARARMGLGQMTGVERSSAYDINQPQTLQKAAPKPELSTWYELRPMKL